MANLQSSIALFEDAAILLDAERGRYRVYGESVVRKLVQWRSGKSKIWPKELADDGIDSMSETAKCDTLISDYRGMRFEKFSSDAWQTRQFASHNAKPVRISRIALLSASAVVLRILGLKSSQWFLGSVKNMLKTTDNQDINDVADELLSASLWSPFKITCIQMSLALARALRSCGYDAKFIIGVRSTPFVAHAWVEVGGSVVGDQPDLRQVYGKITEL